MTLSVPEFWNTLVDAGVADSALARQWASRCAAANGGRFPSESSQVAKWLTAENLLTEYQANAVLQGEGKTLKQGPWILAGPSEIKPFRRWWWASPQGSMPTGSVNGRRLIFRVDGAPTPSPRCRRHLGLKSSLILPLEWVESDEGGWLVTSLTEGERLTSRLRQGGMDVAGVLRLGQQLALALQSVHEQRLIAGEVTADRVWVTPTGSAMLLLDPLGNPVNPFTDQPQSTCLDPSRQPAAAFAAPEFAVPGTFHQPTTDIYALGCLLYQARYGELPFRGASTDDWTSLHGRDWPEPLASRPDDPLNRLIAHCMAKNLEARFASAADVVSAAQHLLTAPAHVLAGNTRSASAKSSPSKSDIHKASKPERAASTEAPPKTDAPLKADAPSKMESGPKPEVRRKTETTKPEAPAKPPTPVPPRPPAIAPNVPTPAAVTSSGASPSSGSVPPSSSPLGSTPASTPKPAPAPAVAAKRPAVPPPKRDTGNVAPPTASPSALSGMAPSPTSSTLPSDPPPAPPPAPSSPPAIPPAAPPAIPSGAAQPSSSPRKRTKKKKKKPKYAPVIIGSAAFAGMMIVVALLISGGSRRGKQDDDREARNPPPEPPPVTEPVSADPIAPAPVSANGTEIVASDPSLLWAAPSSEAARIPLEMVPAGTQTVLMLRPARLLAKPEGRELLAPFDPELSAALASLQQRAGVSAGEMDRLYVAIEEGENGDAILCYSIRLQQPQALASLKQKWGKVEPAQDAEGKVIFAPESPTGDAFYVAEQPPNDAAMISAFAVGPLPSIQRVAEVSGEPVPLPRAAEQLWQHVDDNDDLVFMVNPNLLFAGGRSLLINHAPRLREPLSRMLVPDVSAGLVRMRFFPEWYAELRVTPGGGVNITEVLRKMRTTFDELPTQSEKFLLESSPHPSWRALALRLPQMMRAVATHTRVRADDQQAVANLYLPAPAASNVLLSSWLAANTPAGPATAAVAAAAPTQKAMTFDEVMERKIDVAIVEEDMHAAAGLIQELANEGLPAGSAKVSIQLAGTDLEKDGITQNQKIRNFEQRGVSLRGILTALCMRAHTPTLTDPKDPKQKLVWAMTPDPADASRKLILITTRTAATERYELASEFAGNP